LYWLGWSTQRIIWDLPKTCVPECEPNVFFPPTSYTLNQKNVFIVAEFILLIQVPYNISILSNQALNCPSKTEFGGLKRLTKYKN
jgi:hypothetical protein